MINFKNLSKRNGRKDTKKKQIKKKGFTLVEILIVVAVIGILFVTLIPRIDFAGDKARETGVKTDFRSFELAAEQVLRERAGLADFLGVDDLSDVGGINLYLDKAMQFEDDTCVKNDPWNEPYTMQIARPEGTGVNPNNGAIIFVSNGKDTLRNTTDNNYVLVVTFVDGEISAETLGFSSNIVSNDISIEAAATASMTIDHGNIEIKYKK